MTLLIALTFFISVVLLTIGIRIELEQDTPLARLRQRTKAAKELTPEEQELRRPFLVRFLGPIAQRLLATIARVSPQATKDRMRRRLQAAGNPWHAHSEEIILVKAVLAATGAMLGSWIALQPLGMPLQTGFLAGMAGAGAGYLFPEMVITRGIQRRKKNIQHGLPYILDLLCVCVEAGLAFDGAMQKVAEKVAGPLSDEFRQVAYEVRIGKTRRDALRDMRDRCGVEDLSVFVAAVIQAERLGLGIGQVLRVQSDQLRSTRRERAREMAQKIPLKMLFPLVFLVLPSMFIVILGSAVIEMIRTLSGMGTP